MPWRFLSPGSKVAPKLVAPILMARFDPARRAKLAAGRPMGTGRRAVSRSPTSAFIRIEVVYAYVMCVHYLSVASGPATGR